MSMKRFKPLLWMLAIPALNIIYLMLNHPGDNVRTLVTPLDERTPFIPAFAIPYVTWYPFLAATLIAIFRASYLAYMRTLLSVCLGLIVCYAIYYGFQTTVPRPEVPSGGVLNRLVSAVYASDQPFNCFPSIHVLTSYLMIKGASVLGGGKRVAAALIAVAIIASTLFIKQHVVADVIAGVLLAEIAFRCAGRAIPQVRGLTVADQLRKLKQADYE